MIKIAFSTCRIIYEWESVNACLTVHQAKTDLGGLKVANGVGMYLEIREDGKEREVKEERKRKETRVALMTSVIDAPLNL